MVHLTLFDYGMIAFLMVICFLPALWFGKRSSKSTAEFFASGRNVPWWLAGLSMVATTFASDTPNWVTEQVRKYGVAGNWQWWAMALTGVLTVFLYARLWRRSAVLTDLEFYELRYSGRAAEAVRGFRAVYLGFFFNCFIMGMVTLAACKIADILFGWAFWKTILVCGFLNVIFAAHSGLWGVLVIDMIQFFVKMSAVIAAAYFSCVEVARRFTHTESAFDGLGYVVGHLKGLQVTLPTPNNPVMDPINGTGQPILNMMPNFSMGELALMIFILPIAVGWWANWYPGAEPGGGSYIAQRMLASKSEKDSLGGTLFFNLAHYVLRPWPWIITALCSILIFPDLQSIKDAFPDAANPGRIGHDSAFPAMLHFMPAGWIGLMVGGLIAANSSTILTHLNWGSSYLVHDFYRRFLAKDRSEKHYVNMGRLCTLVLYISAAFLSLIMNSAQEAFEILISIGAGTGLLYLLRWFWWRINAWCEVVAMASSFAISVAFVVLRKTGHDVPFAQTVLVSVAFTTICWVITAFVSPQTEMKTLVSFYLKVKPAGPGWNKVRREAERQTQLSEKSPDNIPLALVGWVSGCITIWSGLFTVGNFLYGRWTNAFILLGTLIVSGIVLIAVVQRLWSPVSNDALETEPITDIPTPIGAP